MTGREIIDRVKELNLPKGSYVVFGSSPLALAGIRGAEDIDLLVNPATLNTLREQGWQQLEKSAHDKPLVHDVFEAHDNWDFSSYSPTLEQLIATADFIDGVPFVSLDEVRKWKVASGRPKHLKDVALIDEYRQSKRR